jgi:Tfp pilus assembly protein PilX
MRQTMKSQDGVALPVASGLLLVVSLLVVGFFTVSLRVNDTSVEDRSSKRALAAAEAGLQMAIYRLNQNNATAATNTNRCFRTTWETPNVSTGECLGQNESLGNGAQYTYYVTPATAAASAGCVVLPGVATSTTDRCVTSVGTVAGVSRRIQTRIVQRPTIPDFNDIGLVGKSLVYGWNSVNLFTDVGSNLRVELNNSVTVNDTSSTNVDGRVLLLTGGTYSYQNSVTVEGGTQTVTTPFDMPVPDFEAIENRANNSLSGTGWTASTRRLSLANSTTKSISPGTYHVCGVHLGNSVKLTFPHTSNQRTKIYVDSPSRPGSSCSTQSDSGAGAFTADNSVEINLETGQREELLDIYLYGTPSNDIRNPKYSWCDPHTSPILEGECKSDFMLDNSVKFYGNVYAPNSTVQAHNSVEITGSVAADKIRFFNSVNFTLTNDVINRAPDPLSAAERKGWSECQPTPTVASNPESGCT